MNVARMINVWIVGLTAASLFAVFGMTSSPYAFYALLGLSGVWGAFVAVRYFHGGIIAAAVASWLIGGAALGLFSAYTVIFIPPPPDRVQKLGNGVDAAVILFAIVFVYAGPVCALFGALFALLARLHKGWIERPILSRKDHTTR